MEEFAAQVAWPGVQPSSFGGGETSETQEPQPDPEDDQEDDSEATPKILEPFMPEVDPEIDPVTAEATPKTTPQVSPVTTPVLDISTPQTSPVMTPVLEISEDEATYMDQDPSSAPQDTPQDPCRISIFLFFEHFYYYSAFSTFYNLGLYLCFRFYYSAFHMNLM